MDKKTERALKALDAIPSRNWRERQRKAQTAARLRNYRFSTDSNRIGRKPEPELELPF